VPNRWAHQVPPATEPAPSDTATTATPMMRFIIGASA
jgi:hypothetical protein